MSFVAVAVTAGVATAGYGVYKGERSKSVAKKERATALDNKKAYSIGAPVYKNQFLAEQGAGGLSDETKMLYEQNSNRGFTTGLDAVLKGGGSINSVSDLFDAYSENSSKIAMMNEEARIRNQNVLMKQNEYMTDAQDKEYQLNHYNRFKDEMQRISEQEALGRAEGNQLIGLGANIATSGMGNFSKEKPTKPVTNTPTSVSNGNSNFTPTFLMDENQNRPILTNRSQLGQGEEITPNYYLDLFRK